MQPNVESGFAGFIANLVNIRSVSLLASALARGPLSQFDPIAVAVFCWHNERFSFEASWELPESIVERYRTLAPDKRSPIERALRENRFIQMPAADFAHECELLAIDHDLWAEAGLEWRSDVYLVLAPIYGHGEALGVLAFATPAEISLKDAAILMGLTGTVALWLFANQTDSVNELAPEIPLLERDVVPLSLTDRQCQILRLIEAGKSNAAIAEAMGLSVSTIKIELRRAMRALRSPNRRAAADTARRLELLNRPSGS